MRSTECVGCKAHITVYDEYYEIAHTSMVVCPHCFTYREKIIIPAQFLAVKDTASA